MRTSIVSPTRNALLSLLALIAVLLIGCVVEAPPAPEPADGILDPSSITSEADPADDEAYDAADEEDEGTTAAAARGYRTCSGRVCPREANACCRGKCVQLAQDVRCVQTGGGGSSAE